MRDNADGFAGVSLILAILSIISILIPVVTPSLSMAAIVCGVLGLPSEEKRSRAMVSIVIGILMLLIGMTVMMAMSAMAPYLEELADSLMQSIQ